VRAAISARGLTRRRGDRVLVDRVDLEIVRGQCVAVSGPPHAGRETLLRLVATLVSATAGELHLAGVDAIASPVAARRHVVYASAAAVAGAGLTAEEFLVFVATARGAQRGAGTVRAALDTAQVAAAAAIDRLSGAARTRLALAAAIVAAAPIVIVERPWLDGDPVGRDSAAASIDAIRRLGATLLIGVDAAEDVATLCDTAVHVDYGRAVPSSSTPVPTTGVAPPVALAAEAR
jgi:ABC-type multidrug transport system ATPase subunit